MLQLIREFTNQNYMPNRKILLFCLSFSLSITMSVSAQTQQIASVFHDVHKVQSKILNEERTFWVRVPLDYQRSSEKYPAVYMLDGHIPQPSMMAGIIEQQSWGGQIPEMILVSIQNTNRSRDLTPTDDGGRGEVGGGDRFLDFIEKEVIPIVEKQYRTHPYRIFAGHSLGGLTVVHALASRPETFNAYIAASPVLEYDKDFVIKETEKLFSQKRELRKTLFMAIGDEPEYKAGWDKFQKLVKKEKPKDLDYEAKEFPEENHASVVLPAYYWGLRKVYEGWIPGKIGPLNELEDHYKKLSKRFGYTIFTPETMLNSIGYQLLQSGKNDEAIGVFRKNAENYPNSSNVFDSLAEAYERSGDKKRAKENYQKAYEIATKKGETLQADVYKKNLERVSQR